MGKRGDDLRKAVESLQGQVGVLTDIVIVGNGWDPATQFPQVKTIYLPENLGIPAGRNAGVEKVSGKYLFFLDDDVYLQDQQTLEKMKRLFEERAEIGLIQPRVISTIPGEATPKRWIPRLRVGDPMKSSVATSLWEGATAISRETFQSSGGWPDEFFYGHEGIDLVWRVLDCNKISWYAADIEVSHPVINPSRHSYFYFLNARNRVWLAKKNLRFPFSLIYPSTWLLISLLRIKGMENLRSWFKGFLFGITSDPREKSLTNQRQRKLRWRTHWLLAKFGRPPLI
jgi:GT2 family glycosyltransferase